MPEIVRNIEAPPKNRFMESQSTSNSTNAYTQVIDSMLQQGTRPRRECPVRPACVRK